MREHSDTHHSRENQTKPQRGGVGANLPDGVKSLTPPPTLQQF